MTKEQELNLKKDRKKFDIREEYFVSGGVPFISNNLNWLRLIFKRLSAEAAEDWEPQRIPRPKGLPEWGVPPTEPPTK